MNELKLSPRLLSLEEIAQMRADISGPLPDVEPVASHWDVHRIVATLEDLLSRVEEGGRKVASEVPPVEPGFYYLAFFNEQGEQEVQECWWDGKKWTARDGVQMSAMGFEIAVWEELPWQVAQFSLKRPS